MSQLRAGYILSYSAGSTQTGPDGFRQINRAGLALTGIVKAHWPERLQAFGNRLPLVINAYPAMVAIPSDGVLIDCYMSVKTASRALQLAAREGMPAMVLSQPLFLGQMLMHHLDQALPLPDAMIAVVGGYWMPQSLHHALLQRLHARGVEFSCLQGYGVAEVDAGMLWGADFDDQGRVCFRARGPDIDAQLLHGRLHLALKDADGKLRAEPFDTGDSAELIPRAGSTETDIVISGSAARLAADIREELSSWNAADWSRRTGYVARTPQGLVLQLRVGVQVDLGSQRPELTYHAFAAEHGTSWLDKPRWGAA
jgi:hypothetical protein